MACLKNQKWYNTNPAGRGSARIERTVRDREVGGPNPPAPTKEPSRNRGFFLLCESGFGTEPLTGCFAKVGGPNPPAPTKEPSRNRGFFLLCESGFGTVPLTGCFAKVGGPNPPAPTVRGCLQIDEATSLFLFGTEPLAGCCAKVGGPNPPAPTKEPSRDGGFFLLIIRVRDRALDRVLCEGRRSKPDRRTFQRWRVLFIDNQGSGPCP